MSRSTLASALVGVVVAAGGGTAATGQEDAAVEPRADRVLLQMSRYLAQASAFTFHAEAAVDGELPSGLPVQFGYGVDVAVRRPDRVRADFSGDRGERSFYYDGETLTLFNRGELLYARAAAPPEIGAALDEAIDRLDVAVPLSDFAYADPHAVLTERVRAGSYAGRHRVGGIACHHLVFSQESIDWEIWIEDGPQPVPRKLYVVYKREPRQPRYTALLSEWRLGAPLSDAVFDFDPPPGADEIGFAPPSAPEGGQP